MKKFDNGRNPAYVAQLFLWFFLFVALVVALKFLIEGP